MFAIAWKEYRQIRLVALLLVTVLLVVYFAAGLTPWADSRAPLVPTGIVIIVAMLGATAFTEEKQSGTWVFLAALPMRVSVRWLSKALSNLAIAAGAVGIFLAFLSVAQRAGLLSSTETYRCGLAKAILLAGVLAAVWSAGVFYSSVFDRSVTAMLLTWAVIAGLFSPGSFLSLGQMISETSLSVEVTVALAIAIFLFGAVSIVFLLASFLFERRMPGRPSAVEKALWAPAVTIAAVAGPMFALLGLVHLIRLLRGIS